jgi:tetratricopeptide (TPR) repeat protein
LAPSKEAGFQAGYTSADVAQILGLTPGEIRGYVRAGFLRPRKGSRGEHRFGLQDLVLLRTAKALATRVPPKRLRKALRTLGERLPKGKSLTGVRITAVGDSVVVRDGNSFWRVDSGQGVLDFEVREISARVAPLARKAAAAARVDETRLGPEDWYSLALDLEACDPEQARDAYRRALELDPQHAAARVNLGRLLHELGRPGPAAAHYRLALQTRPNDATAAFNLGVALEDLHEDTEAILAYERAVEADPGYADAFFNLSRVYERSGRASAAFRALKTYRSLVPR